MTEPSTSPLEVPLMDVVETVIGLVVTTGVAVVLIGAAVPLPSGLGQLLTVCVTVYVPAEVTVTDDEVAPVLQSNDPVADVDNVETPQPSSTVTSGVEGVDPGAAVPLPAELTHVLTVWVTV